MEAMIKILFDDGSIGTDVKEYKSINTAGAASVRKWMKHPYVLAIKVVDVTDYNDFMFKQEFKRIDAEFDAYLEYHRREK